MHKALTSEEESERSGENIQHHEERDVSYQNQASSSSDASSGNEDSYQGYYEGYQQRMEADFEAAFDQYNSGDEREEIGQDQSREGESTPADPRLIDISDTEKLVSDEGHSDAEKVKGHKKWGAEEDVEEGEVSDSSSDGQSGTGEGDQVGL